MTHFDAPYDAPPPSSRLGHARFTGDGVPLFWLMVRTSLLTVVTLGIYRFWMRTKLRQYYWSSIVVDDTPLEYTGTGLEKFLGFLLAIVVVAFYLMIINGVLYVFTLSVFDGHPLAPTLSGLAILPLALFAQYRGRRYLMSRTRLRGIRFSLEPGAGRFVLFGLKQMLVTAVTLGVLYPRMQWKLDQYITQRTRLGDTNMDMHAHWRSLMRPWLLMFGPFAGALVIMGMGALGGSGFGVGFGFFVFVCAYIATPFLAANYYVKSLAMRTSAKSLGAMTLQNNSRSGKIIGIWVLGTIIISIMGSAVGAVFLIIGSSIAAMGFAPDILNDPVALEAAFSSQILVFLGVGAMYLLTILLYVIGYQVFIHRPCIEHFVNETALYDVDELSRVTQSSSKDIVDAEGFADALDVGAAF